MKRILLPLFMVLLPLMASAFDAQVDGIYYNLDINAKTAEVTFRDNNGNSYSGSVTIPTSFTYQDVTYSVTGIGQSAFYYCNGLTSIEIPISVTGIGQSAFSFCSNLISVVIPDSVASIGRGCFSNCTMLKQVTIGEKVTDFGYKAFADCNNISSVIFKSNYVPDYFSGFASLKEVIFEENVRTIGTYAFKDCIGLESVVCTEEGIMNLTDEVFYNCKNLTVFSIPKSLISIGNLAFYNCNKLTRLSIPKSTRLIANNAFCYCNELSTIIVEEGNEFYDSRENCNAIIETQTNRLIIGCMNTKIPESVSVIGSVAFIGCSSLTSLSIPKGITKIEGLGGSAFSDCSRLSTIVVDMANSKYDSRDNCNAIVDKSTAKIIVGCMNTVIPESINGIEYNAFYGCTSLQSLYLPQSINSIDESAFYNCTGLESIIVDSKNPYFDSRDNCNAIIETATNKLIVGCSNTVIPLSVTDYGRYGLANCINLKLPDGIKEIPNLYNCKALESITIPNSIKKINDYSFNGCSSLKNIIFEDGTDELTFETYFTYSGYQSKWYKDNPLDSLYIGRNIETNNNLPFGEHPTLRAIAFGEEVKNIGNSAFNNCRNLCSIRFGSQLETIGSCAFWNCLNIDKIIISPSIKAIGDRAFYCSHISNLIIEDGEDLESYNGNKGTEFIGGTIDSLYLGRSNVNLTFKRIKHLTIGQINKLGGVGADTINVLSIIESPDTLLFTVIQKVNYNTYSYYYVGPLNNIYIDSLYCNRIVGIINTYNSTATVHPFEGIASSFKLEIGRNITDIGDGMFYGCKIPSLYIPNKIRHISPTAFNNCSTLNSLTIEDSTEPLDFGEGSNFYGCQLRDVYIGRNMQYSTYSPFYRNKESINNIVFGENITEIPANAFLGLKNLQALVLPQKLQKISDNAFYGCEGLTSLTIPCCVTEIGIQAFDLCRNLKTLTFENGTETLVFTAPENNLNNAFQNSPLEDIYLGRNISFTNSSPFSISEFLKTLTIGSVVTHLNDKTFIGCPNLKDVTSYANTVPTTGEVVFTPSYLPSATLHVPYELYNQYKVAPTWKDFGNIMNFEGLYYLTYIVDGEVYKDSIVEQNSPITPETEPTKDYYTFSGWSEIPEVMPSHDVTITGSFIPQKYKLTYQVDSVDYKVYDVAYGSSIALEADPVKEGHTFSGWSEIPEVMPAHDVTVTGTFIVNKYKVRYYDGDKLIAEDEVEYGAEVVLRDYTPEDTSRYTFIGWDGEKYETMPAHDIEYHANIADGVSQLAGIPDGVEAIYDANGRKLSKMQRGVNILLMSDGTKRKIIVK